jgi:hypothetical protein
MSTKIQTSKNIVSLVEAINTLFTEFLTTQGKRKAQCTITDFTSEDFQAQLTQIITDNMPKAPRKARKARAPKDPEAPKAALTSYMLFATANRARVKASLDDDAKVTDVSKALGHEWKALKEEGKEGKYVKQAKAEKKRFAAEMEEYTPSDEYLARVAEWKANGGETKTKAKRGKRKPKDPEAPKRATTSYMLFAQANRARVKASLDDDAKVTDVSKALGHEWKALKEEGKAGRYIKAAEAEKKRYAAEMEEYTPSEEYLALVEEWKANGGVEKKRATKAKTSTTKKSKRDPNAPKRAKTAYLLFTQEMRPIVSDDNEDMSKKEVNAYIRAMWKGTDADGDEVDEADNYSTERSRRKWARLAKADKKRYLREMKSYTPPADESDDEQEEDVVEVKRKTVRRKTVKKAAAPKAERKRKRKVVVAAPEPEPLDEPSETEVSDDEALQVQARLKAKIAAKRKTTTRKRAPRKNIRKAATQPVQAAIVDSEEELSEEVSDSE